MSTRQPESPDTPSSPDDGNFRQSLQIDMKGLVGDAVGNMSISPGSRDVVLAARKGLFIIDLEAPLNVPRFLPQGGTWDVADVQWNPHISRKEYIVSTSSEKLLIWNLYLSGKTSIEHILRSHYRAITDINWHTSDPDIVVSTGIDSWLWAWDLRTTQKPVMGLCAFNGAGTQVKWNRQDGNILASSHLNEILIWDRRKGSLPVSQIQAHGAKIYGIDWAHNRRNEIVTCSLDKTIKIWDVQQTPNEHGLHEPTSIINTAYPVWRARDLPFGHGVLSLPQRGETALEMWSPEDQQEPIERFEGHADVVKEFVWRKGGEENSEFQLITWSKDKTLRFWPVDAEIMQKVGSSLTTPPAMLSPPLDERVSFSNPPIGTNLPPALSAPVGHRSILAEVRASQPLRPLKFNALRLSQEIVPTRSSSKVAAKKGRMPEDREVDKHGTMSRGYVGGRSAHITTFAWLSSVKVGNRRDGSSGPASGGDSGNVSRIGSRSRPPSVMMDPSMSMSLLDVRSGSRDRGDDDSRESEANQSLQEEITSVVNKLSASKVKLEKADLTKRRTCTFGLHGPWGDSTSVFIRISFTFPRDYPQASHPGGTPQVDMERNPLISMKNRVVILRRLRAVRESQRPCLEACLRFLLFGDADEQRPSDMDSESSSEDEALPATRRVKEGTLPLLRGDKNLAEPRTSQGVFGPNGELVCFFRAPPRIVRNPLREMSASPSAGSRSANESAPRLFWSPVLLSDAMRRLALAAHDREVDSLDLKRTEDAHSILRIMTNLFSFSPQKFRRISEHSRPVEEFPNKYSLLPTRRSTVFIKDASPYVGIDIRAAKEYKFPSTDPTASCKSNAETARLLGRLDHERVFNLLEVIMMDARQPQAIGIEPISTHNACNSLTVKMIDKLYTELCYNKDIQMLAMISVALLRFAVDIRPSSLGQESITMNPQRSSHLDYFSFKRNTTYRQSPLSPAWSRASPSPTLGQPVAPPLSSPSSSRGSWSSLFNTTSMRRFISTSKSGIPMNISRTHYSPQSPRMKEFKGESPTSVTTPGSWPESIGGGSGKNSISFSSTNYHSRRPTFSQVVSSGPPTEEKKRVVVEITPNIKLRRSVFRLPPQQRRQLEAHIWAYADMLLAWQLPQKRAELLEAGQGEIGASSSHPIVSKMLSSSPVGIVRSCGACGRQHEPGAEICLSCGGRLARERCSICRLPVKGLSQTCLACLHITHVSCWRQRKDTLCATGCGCRCSDPTAGINCEDLLQSPPVLTYGYM